MPAFVAAWARLGFSDDDLRQLEMVIMVAPQRGPVVQGLGGVRKLRFAGADSGTGKRGGARVCYAYFDFAGIVVLLSVFTKSRQPDLTQEQRRQIASLVSEIEAYLKARQPHE